MIFLFDEVNFGPRNCSSSVEAECAELALSFHLNSYWIFKYTRVTSSLRSYLSSKMNYRGLEETLDFSKPTKPIDLRGNSSVLHGALWAVMSKLSV